MARKITKVMGDLQISPKRMHGFSLRSKNPHQRLHKSWGNSIVYSYKESYVAARLARKIKVRLGVSEKAFQGKETDCLLRVQKEPALICLSTMIDKLG